ncbi:MAG: PDZ domain-containing protein, partial [Magnetococcales bacterium]|nr:PDZ domain-containing protein [Magnetococcales bacterium]
LLPMDAVRVKETNSPYPDGALVQWVAADSAAAKAGFVVGDVIFKFNGRRIKTPQEFLKRLLVGELEEARVAVVRQGKRQNLMLSLTAKPPSYVQQQANATSGAVAVAVANPVLAPQSSAPVAIFNNIEWMGMELLPIDAALRTKRKSLANLSGAVVAEVKPGSAAETSGLVAGDVIFSVNSQPVMDVTTLKQAIQAAQGVKTILLEVGRNNKRMFATLL